MRALALKNAHSGSADIDRYVEEVAQYPLLSRDQELDLARRYRDTGEVAAAHQLVVSNLRFVVKIAHSYRGYGLKLLDIIQEGNIGLMHAVKKFDPERGYRLISYAVWWIRAQIQSYVMRSWSLVKLGSGRVRRKLFFKLRSERSAMEHEAAGEVAGRDALAERLGVDIAEIDEMQVRLAARDFSLDAPLADDSDQSHLDMLSAGEAPQEAALIARQEHEVLDTLLAASADQLNEKEAYILQHRLLAEEPPTLGEIGDQFGISRERVRQLEQRVIKKLRATAEQMGGPAPLSQPA